MAHLCKIKLRCELIIILKCKLNVLQQTIPYTVIKKKNVTMTHGAAFYFLVPPFFFCNYQFM